MLPRTFVHINGIGYATERRLWEAGFDTWGALLQSPDQLPFSPARCGLVADIIAESSDRLEDGDFAWFARELHLRDHWRAMPDFQAGIGYLDIETDGSTDENCVTVIGLYDGETVQQFVRGENLLDFPEALAETSILVTFFGSGFDLPVLKRQFPRLKFPQLHVDACWLFRRLGYQGGLKSIERQLGYERSAETQGVDGWAAVRLWREHLAGSREALELLKRYNAEDILSLKPLTEIAFQGMLDHTLDPQT